MKRFFVFSLILFFIINWSHTEAQVQDTISPTVAITVDSVVGPEFEVTVTFSEPVTGFVQSGLTFAGSGTFTITDWDAQTGGMVYVATVTATSNSFFTSANVAANVAQDTAMNWNTEGSSSPFWVDVDGPTVTFNLPSGTPSGTFDVTIRFSENVTDFVRSDIAVHNGTLDALTGSGRVYMATITPTASGDVVFGIDADQVKDAVGNGNAVSVATVTVDLVAPTVMFSDVPPGRQNGNFTITITFSENVTGFTSTTDDIVLSPNTLATVSSLTGADMTYTATIAPTAGQEGTLTITVPANAAVDGATNGNDVASTTVDIDAKPPTLTITPPSGTQTAAFDVTFAFSEAVTGFTSSDIRLDAGARVSSFTGSNPTYTATITPKTTSTVTISVEAGVVQDTVGNGNEAASITVGVDLPHAIMVMDPEDGVGPYSKAFTVMIMFTESVDSFTDSDITLSPSGLATVSVTGGSAPTYTATITPNAGETGDLDIQVEAGDVQGGGIDYPASNTVTVEVDTERPTVTEIEVPDDPQNSAFDVTIRFSEAVNGFDPDDDITFGGSASATPSLKSGSDGDTEYEVTITPSSSGNLTIEVDGDAAKDDAGNGSAMSDAASVTIDQDAPTVTISDVPTDPQKDAFTVDIDFNENVENFDMSNITLAGDDVASVTGVNGSGKDYTATITPAGMGNITIQVVASEVQDTAGNDNEASNTVTIAIDSVKPTVMLSGVPTGRQKNNFTITITFSESVTGFVKGDIELSPTTLATVSSLSGSGMTYTATIAPTTGQEGTLTITVPANAAVDDATNENTAASTTVEVDKLGPTSTISGAPSGTVNAAFDITVTFSDSVRSFVPNHFDFGGDATGSVTASVVDADNKVFMVTITPDSDQDGVMTIQVPSGRVPDTLGNRASGSNTVTIDVDTIKPTVTFLGVPTTKRNRDFTITIRFDETVYGFLDSEIILTPTGLATVSNFTGDDGDTVYTATIAPIDEQDGTLTITVPAGAATDGASNGNEAASTTAVEVDRVRPTSTISGEPPSTVNGAFIITVTFSESMRSFVPTHLEFGGDASGSVTNSVVNANKTVYTLTITPSNDQDGEMTIQVEDGRARGADGNVVRESNTVTIDVDTKKPTVLITDALTPPTMPQKGAFELTIRFSESVSDFIVSDITLGGSESASASVSGSGTTYTATITPNSGADGTVTISVAAGAATDAAGNGNTASDIKTVTVDLVAPTVIINAPPTTEQNAAFDLTIMFSEAVTGFGTSSIMVTGEATATAVSGSSDSYTATITPTANQEDDVTVTVNANAVTDAAGNSNPVSATTSNIHIDTIVPTVSISGVPTGEQKEAFPLTITFLEDVSGFATEDLTVPGQATATVVSGGPQVYTATITPTANQEDDVTVTVRAGAVTDTAGNNNTVSATTSAIHIDTIAPTATISGLPSGEQKDAFPLTITFDENVTGFAAGDLMVTGQATATVVSGGPQVYTATITPNDNQEDDVTVQVKANAVTDAAGNSNPASATTSNIHIDTIAPTVTISGLPSGEENDAFNLTITFNEDVSGFATGDLTVTGQARATAVSGGPRVYTATITPNATSEGDVTVRVNATTVKDFALNDNTASNTPSVHVDTIRPTVRFEDVPVLEKRNDIFEIKVVFSEPVNGFQGPADMTIDGPVTASLTSGSDGAAEYTVTITPNPTSKGDLTFRVNANTVQDLALNNNTASEVTDAVRIDTVPPIAEITNLPTVAGAPFDVTITFNEEVTGFATADIALTGPATATLKSGVDGDTIYTATITPNPNAKGDVRILIPAGVVKDLALNDNIPSEITPPVHVDTNALTVQITDVPETVQLEDFSVMIKFSMGVADFVLADITLSGDAAIQTSSLTGRGNVYLLKITPEADTDGDVTIQVPAGVATDAASNSNTASVPQTVSVAPKWMPEAGLRDATREVLGLDAGEDFERAELKKLTTLTAESSDIRILTGLEAATNLTALDLSGNAITDIALLRGLTKLTILDLGANAITDITTLAQLTELTTLDLSGNAITDITLLRGLTKLTTLDLGGNAITDIAVLAGLTKLTTLNLSDNPISNLNPLLALTSLTTLGLSGNAINDLTVISGLTGLLVLNLSDNAIADITLLQNLTALTALDLSGNTVSNLITLAGLTQLRTLNLNNNTVSDLTSLGGLTNLTTLALVGNAISTLNPIATLQQLTLLDLRDNNISDVSTLASLANLTTLRLMGNPILDTTPLYPLTQRLPPVDIDIAVSQYTPWDVNADGSVDAADSALVTVALGQSGEGIVNPRTDVNGDGRVDNADLLLVTGNFDNVPGAPAVADILRLLDPATLASLNREVLATELQRLVLESDGSLKYRRAIELLQRLLAVQRPDQTRLFANYPNPFNPETWIPYQLAVGSKVELVIYDVKGVVVRHLGLGHQPAGYYTQKNRAAYWDGRNAVGERVASGIYFYQLRADNVSLLRKMVILK